MNRLTLKLLATIIALWMTTAAYALDVPLTYVRHPDERDSFLPGGATALQGVLERPTGEWKLPQLTSKQPIYAFTEIGDKQRLLILDREKAADFFYNRLYFDANRNQDLTDDPVIDGSFTVEEDQICLAAFPATDTTVDLGETSLPYSFRVSLVYLYFGDDGRPDKELTSENLSLSILANCYYSGEFQLESQTYRVLLGDGNVNGRFDDKFSPLPPGGDLLCVTSGAKPGPYDVQPLANLFLTKGTLFDVDIRTAESKMTLTPVTEDLAPLNLAMATERMTMGTERGWNFVVMYQPGNEVMIPRGNYRLLGYTAVRKDDQGDEWLLQAAAPSSPVVTVNAGMSPTLNFGEPYVPSVGVPPWARDTVREGNTQLPLWLTVKGAAGEHLAELTRISGNRTRIPLSEENPNRPKEPTYKIVQPDGQIVAQGSFEYG
jgi:hypothetical protein